MKILTTKDKILSAIRNLKRDKILNKKENPDNFRESIPPFYAIETALLMRCRTWKTTFIVSAIVLGGIILFQQRIISHKLFEKMNEEIVIVPGSPEFFRVRPGQIPQESAFNFAEFIAGNLGNFSYRNVQYHFGKISEFMAPLIKSRFESDTDKHVNDWTSRKVDQSFSYDPVKKFDLVNDDFGPKYVVAVTGTRTQYVEGHAFSETKDVLLIEFRPQGNLTPEKPFIFQIENLEWLTPQQFESIKNSRGLGKEKAS